MKRRIPPQRLAVFDMVAEASKTERVVVACTSSTVRRQYIRAIEKRGGRLENVYFHMLTPTTEDAP